MVSPCLSLLQLEIIHKPGDDSAPAAATAVSALGDAIPFRTMADIVEQEPINLVCVFWGEASTEFTAADIEPLKLAVQSYRLPFVRIGSPLLLREEIGGADRFTFPDLNSLRNFLNAASRS